MAVGAGGSGEVRVEAIVALHGWERGREGGHAGKRRGRRRREEIMVAEGQTEAANAGVAALSVDEVRLRQAQANGGAVMGGILLTSTCTIYSTMPCHS